MNKTIFLSAIVICAVACKSPDKKTSEEIPAVEVKTETKPESKQECYAYISAKDTVKLSLSINGTVATGTLSYNFFEKDKNTGTIQGRFAGDTLIADYTFRSEGTESVREVAFLRSGNTYTEGYGESEEKKNKMVFKNINKLDFSKGTKLSKTNCE